MPAFVPGLKLCESFFEEAVRPVLASRFPQLLYSAARLDEGSDVLDFDAPRSMDHHWGPRVSLFVSESDYQTHREKITPVLANELPLLHRAFESKEWKEREQHLSAAYVAVGGMHNALGVTPPIEAKVAPFWNRPYLVIHADRYCEALHRVIESGTMKGLPRHVGAISQFVDSTDVSCSVNQCKALAAIYKTSA